MDQRAQRLTVLTLFLLWLFTVIAAYYVVHKPFGTANVQAAGKAALGLGGASLVVALGAGVGLMLVRWLELAPLERLVCAAALGLGVVSLAGLALGALGLLRPWVLWLLMVAGLAATVRPLWQALRAAWVDRSWQPKGRFGGLLAGYCGVVLVVALAWALAPPTAWDGLVYHLTGPKLFLATGRVSHSLDLPYLGFPQLVEMLFAWGMGLTGERAAAAIHWFYLALTVLTLVAAGRRWLGGAAGWMAAAALLSASSISMLAGWPYVDLALLLYTTLAFLALARFCGSGAQARPWLVLSGIFAGLAISTKYTALALLPALSVALLTARTLNLRSATRSLLLLSAVALVVWSPWLLKNLLLTGNPIYPFSFGLFGGKYWDDWRAWWYDRPGTGLAYTAPWKLLTAPWDATIWGAEGREGYASTIGPLFLALLPLLLLTWRGRSAEQRRWLRAALAFCGVIYGFWLWGLARSALLHQSRLLLPAFGLLALVVGAAVERLDARPRWAFNLGWLVRGVMALVLLLSLSEVCLAWINGGPQRVLLGFESQEEFLTRRLGWYYVVIEDVNRRLPPDAVVLFLWEPRSYHCRVECWPDALLDRFLHATHLYGYDADAIAATWRAEGVTHVLLYRAGYQGIVEAGFDPVTPDDLETMRDLQARHLSPVKEWGDVYVLYELIP